MTYLYVKVKDKKLEVFLKSLDDMEDVEVVEVERPETKEEKADRENHALRRAWNPNDR